MSAVGVDVLAVMDHNAACIAGMFGAADVDAIDMAAARAVIADLLDAHKALLDWHALKRNGELKAILKQARAAHANATGAAP